ncbi:MAG: glycoside hydrolase family 92 protein [Lewinellaceae bacterium]|nr:glycoside hydrolase family 92 protein [Lewinellaceae bacterium]
MKSMKKLSLILFLALAFGCRNEKEPAFDALQYVDPQIGSVHGRWFFYTPAALPFGMAKLAPHTNAYEGVGSWAPQGYDGRHTSIEGFGHFHEFQIGGVVVMPTTGDLKTVPGSLEDPDAGYRSRFDKGSEQAEPGYYSVFLKDHQVKVEMTATERAGFHRYTFPASAQSHLIFDIGHKQGESSTVTDAWARWDGGYQIEGYVETFPEYLKFCDPENRVKMYFAARLNKQPEAAGAFVDAVATAGERETKGTRNGLYLTFPTTENEVVEMQVGLSYTSTANARLNLEAETEGLTFDAAHQRASQAWNALLGRIQVEGGKHEDRVKFYTGLYHALLGRGIAEDVNGRYPTHQGGIGQIPLNADGKPQYHHFNTDGIWGGFWNLGQLWALAYPEYLSQYVQSNIDFYKETGWLHDGTAAGAFANGVQTNFQGLLLASAFNCGIRDFDVPTGYEAARKNELEWRGRNLGNGKYDLHWFIKNGYVPFRDTTISNGWVFNFGASHTLEYSYSSYAVAQMAKGLGRESDYRELMKQAGYWKNLFDPESRFIRPRLPDGAFIEDFDPMKAWYGFQEGNAFQYTWYVPHDIAGLIEAMGRDTFNGRLERMFNNAQKSLFGGGEEIHSFSGIEKLYNHGNQPCLHNPWLFNYSGKPWLAQKWARAICNEFYGVEPLHGYGYGQDEDQGQLGAWYVMAAMGLFDVQGHAAAAPSFQFGSPLFDRVSIRLNREYYPGRLLAIETVNNGQDSIYIQSLSFNGAPLDQCWIERSKLMEGGRLVFKMGGEPNMAWGTAPPPPSGMEE